MTGYDPVMATASHTQSPYVERRAGVCGGIPVIHGTRFPVKSIVVYVLRHGMTPDEVVREWTHLTLAQVYGALAFYYDNRAEIDAFLEEEAALFEQAKKRSS
jgi:uncharacterized protein (DUF433 family)